MLQVWGGHAAALNKPDLNIGKFEGNFMLKNYGDDDTIDTIIHVKKAWEKWSETPNSW